MIRETQLNNALQALKDLLVTARTMAFERESHERMAAFLDAVEELPMLIARSEDLTDAYRSALEDIAVRFPEASVALQRCEANVPR